MKCVVAEISHRRHSLVCHLETFDQVRDRLFVEFCQFGVVRGARQPLDHQSKGPPLTIDAGELARRGRAVGGGVDLDGRRIVVALVLPTRGSARHHQGEQEQRYGGATVESPGSRERGRQRQRHCKPPPIRYLRG